MHPSITFLVYHIWQMAYGNLVYASPVGQKFMSSTTTNIFTKQIYQKVQWNA